MALRLVYESDESVEARDTARSYIFEERADSKSSRWPPTEVKNKRGVHKKNAKSTKKGKTLVPLPFLLFIEDAERRVFNHLSGQWRHGDICQRTFRFQT